MAKVATSHGKYKGVIVSKTDMRKLKAGLQAKMKDIVALLVKQLSFIGGGVHTNRPREWQLQRYYRQFEVINRLCGACGREARRDGSLEAIQRQGWQRRSRPARRRSIAPKSASEISVGRGSDRLRRHEIRRVCRSSPPQGRSHLRRVESRIACQEITQRSNRIAR